MSQEIDNRVVQMEFDNSKFDSRIKNSLQSLSSLKKGISSLDDSAKSLRGITDAANRLSINTDGVVGAIDSISDRFTNLGIIGMSVLTNLTNKAVDFGIKFVKSVSIDQVMEGFSKYTAETNAVQTIWSATKEEGESLEHIYDVLGDILDYTDRTSYHYDSMVGTISKFVNAGVGLEKAATAVQGIANWAAYSGAGIEKADIAMNALINAMSQGYVAGREWQTILKSADMGTKQFKQLVIDTGEQMGILAKNEITLENFAEKLGKGKWFTSELLLEVLQQYGDETTKLGQDSLAAASEAKTFAEAVGAVKDAVSTGWKTSFTLLFGQYDEAKKWWTSLQDAMLEVFTLGMNKRNEILKQWHEDLGGYKELMDAFHNFWLGVKNIAKPIGDVLKSLFPDASGYAERLKEITDSVYNLSIKFRYLYETATELVKPGGKADTIGYLEKNDDRIQAATKRVEKLRAVVRRVMSVFFSVKDIIRQTFDGVKLIFKWFTPLAGTVKKVIGALFGTFESVTKSLSGERAILNFFEKLDETVGPHVRKFVAWIDTAVDAIIKFAQETHIFEDIKQKFNAFKDTIVNFCKKHFKFPTIEGLDEFAEKTLFSLSPLDTVFNALEKVLDGVKKAIDWIKPIISDFIDFAVEKAKKLSDDGSFFGFIRGLIGSGILAGIGAWIWNLSGVVKNVNWTLESISDAVVAFSRKTRLRNFKTIATSVLMLSGAMLILSSIDAAKLIDAGLALTIILGELVASVALFNKIGQGDKRLFGSSTSKAVKGLITLAASVLILALAVKVLSKIPATSAIKGVLAVGAILLELAAFVKLMGGSNTAMKTGVGLMFVAVAVRVLVKAVENLGSLDMKTLEKGLGAILVLLLELGIFVNTTSGAKGMLGAGLGILLISAALHVLYSAVEKFGKMNWNEMVKGLGAVFVVLLSLSAIVNSLSGAGAFGSSLGILILSAALEILYDVATKFASMSWEELGKAGAALVVALGAIAVALNLMKGTIFGALALLTASVAIGALALSLKLISKIKANSLAKALGTIAVSLLVLLGAASVAGAMIGGLLALGIGLVAFAAGLLAMFLPLKLLGGLKLEEIGVALVAMLGSLAAILAASAVGAIAAPMMLASAAAIVVFAAALLLMSLGMRAIIELFKTVSWEDMGKAASVLAGGLVAVLAAAAIGAIAAPGMMAFAVGITAIGAALVVLGLGLAALGGGLEIATGGINDFVDFAHEKGAEIVENVKASIKNSIDSIKQKVSDFKQAARDSMIGIIDGIKDKKDEIVNNVKTVINTAWAALKGKITEWWQIGKDLIQGLIDGIVQKGTDLKDKVTSTVDSAVQAVKDLLGINSPSKTFAEIGKFSMMGLIKGFDDEEDAVDKKAEEVAKSAYARFKKAIEDAAAKAEKEMNTNPIITPVVDLSGVKRSAQAVSGMFSATTGVTATGTIAAYTDTGTGNKSGTNQNGSNSSVTYNFNQVNNSPKALDRSEIYRQTNNQFAALKNASSASLATGGAKKLIATGEYA